MLYLGVRSSGYMLLALSYFCSSGSSPPAYAAVAIYRPCYKSITDATDKNKPSALTAICHLQMPYKPHAITIYPMSRTSSRHTRRPLGLPRRPVPRPLTPLPVTVSSVTF